VGWGKVGWRRTLTSMEIALRCSSVYPAAFDTKYLQGTQKINKNKTLYSYSHHNTLQYCTFQYVLLCSVLYCTV